MKPISGKFQINFGTGLFYQHTDFYLGFSVPNLLASEKVKLKNDVMTSISDRMHFYVLGGYFWDISPYFTIKPSLQVRATKDISPAMYLTIAANYMKNSELGITYRTEKAINAYLLFHIPNYYISIGYGYEANLQTNLNLYARNSHEFLVQFKF